MGVLLVFVACFLLYGKSKYFPSHLSKIGDWIKQHMLLSRSVACLTLAASLFLFAQNLGWGTGSVAFLIAWIFAYCILLIVLPLNRGYAYLMTGLFLTTIIVEYIL